MLLYKTMQIKINTNNILGSAYSLNEDLNNLYIKQLLNKCFTKF